MNKLISVVFIVRTIFCDEDVPSVTLENVEYNTTTGETTTEELNLDWLPEAVRDVAYYLRQHKFNEYDHRYEKKPTNGSYFALFPKPALRSLHWEIQLHCEVSFVHCMEYVNKKVQLSGLRRKDDTSTVIVQQNWTESNQKQIKTVEQECQSKKKLDNALANPFQGPIERFKWRTSASYYLCWYAMNGVPILEYFGQPCDNFASCLDPKLGAQNKDVRADDDKSFGCALYSFCPDPCCPIKHISTFEECYNSELNPCKQDNGNNTCLVPRANNTDLTSVILNQWNVSCSCPVGYTWRSRYGLCVDVDECAVATHTCSKDREVCVNQPGGYLCACGWAYQWSELYGTCEQTTAVKIGKVKAKKTKEKFRFSLKEVVMKVIGGRGVRWGGGFYIVVFFVVCTVFLN